MQDVYQKLPKKLHTHSYIHPPIHSPLSTLCPTHSVHVHSLSLSPLITPSNLLSLSMQTTICFLCTFTVRHYAHNHCATPLKQGFLSIKVNHTQKTNIQLCPSHPVHVHPLLSVWCQDCDGTTCLPKMDN